MALRIGTFNARFLPHLPSNARRARVLAERIRAGGYDLIALTEVFSGRARRVLLEGLAGEYPWNVQYIGSRRLVREDSGLMLFSRVPFDALPATAPNGRLRVRACANGTAPDRPPVWFVEYSECASSDCLAGKGAGYVRLRHAGRPLHVFFTHLQAAYDYHGPRQHARTRRVRTSQLRQLAALVQAALGPEGDRAANAVILGDLNVDGVRSTTGAVQSGDGAEWRGMMELLNGCCAPGLVDVWDGHAPFADPGHTFPSWSPSARRDYVLLSAADPVRPLAVHQVSLAHELARPNDNGDFLSDHVGICVDLNLHQTGCQPLDAHIVGEVGDGILVTGRIDHPGGLQWYAVERFGAVTLDVTSLEDGLETPVAMYHAADISRPLPPADDGSGGASTGVTRYLLEGASLIRVGEPTSRLAGTFNLRVTPGVRADEPAA
jgi:endonuclease/exonuclease/phosphatase family metal-dependent hydrolase